MAGKRLLVHYLFWIALPVVVAYFGFSTVGAIAVVLLMLAWRLGITVSVLLLPPAVPKLELETIAASHFVEKVRWSMDRLGVDYVERQVAGIIGVLFTGRTVPQLKIRTGRVRSIVSQSGEILRYLWGSNASTLGDKAAFLAPTEERLELERRIDSYGSDLQVWVYYHVLADRSLCLHLWGRNSSLTPLWQRWLLAILFPGLRFFLRQAFKISDEHYVEAVKRIDEFMRDVEGRLADGRRSILSGNEIDYVDIAFASISGVWLRPEGYGAGKADEVRVTPDRLPLKMRSDIERWRSDYRNSVAFVEKLYAEERQSA